MFLFDLDGTVIDSSHRTDRAHSTGKFCLSTYLAHCNSPDLIAQDSLLPLARYMQALVNTGKPFAVITARYMTDADHTFLIENELVSHNTLILGRDSVKGAIRALPDAVYKVHQLKRLESHFRSIKHFTLFDDRPDICEAFNALPNVTAVDAVALNKALGNRAELVQDRETIQAFQSFSSDLVMMPDLFTA